MHPLQKYSVDCFWIPSVMSIEVRRHATHVLAGLGSMAVPHSQQSLWSGGRIRYLGGSCELTFSEGPTRGGLQLLCIPFLGLGLNEY